MPSPTRESGEPADLLSMVQREIMLARAETRPTSRQQLADIVRERTGMPFNDAFAFVDTYCDENEPGVPGYLQEEFAVPYLKVVAVVNVIIGVFLIYRGVQAYHANQVVWGWYCGGVLFCGAAAFAWVQSLEREILWRKKKRRV